MKRKDETKEYEFTAEVNLPLRKCPLDTNFLLSLQKSYDDIEKNQIESAIEFLESQGYKVIKN